MKRYLFPKVMVVAITSVTLSVTSCINEEYDMSEDKVNLEVTPFQEGLAVPLGSTDVIKLQDVLDKTDLDAIKAGIDGAYAISFEDSFDMSEELLSLKEMVDIPDVNVSSDFTFRLNDVDISDVEVAGRDYVFDYDISTSFDLPDLTLPDMGDNVLVPAGLHRFSPNPEDLKLGFDPFVQDTRLISISDAFVIPAPMLNDTPISMESNLLKDYMSFSEEFSFTEKTSMAISLPTGINAVDQVVLSEGAAMKVTMELTESFLLSGDIIPEIDIDLSDIFHLGEDAGGDIVSLGDDFILSEQNGYKQAKEFSIASLAISSEDWSRKTQDAPICLNKDMEISANGKVSFRDLMTTTRLIDSNRDVDVYLSLEFINLQIEDIKMSVDPIELAISEDIEVTLNDINLPEEIESINSIKFAEGSGLDIRLTAENIDRIRGLEAEIESLVFAFPEEISVKGADAYNQVKFRVEDLSEDFDGHIEVTGLNLPDPINGKIAFNESIRIDAVAKAGGFLHLADLPDTEADDMNINVDVRSEFEIADYAVDVAGFDFALDMEPEMISVELPESLKDMKELTIIPEGSPVVQIELDIPDMGLTVLPSSNDGLKLTFPKMFRFSTPLPSDYNYDYSTNSITLRNELPSVINLPIDRLVINPEVDPIDGKVYARGETVLSGGLEVSPCTMDKADVEKMASSDLRVSAIAKIPQMKPSVVGMDKFESSISKTMDVTIIKAEDLPSEVVSLGEIKLDDTYLNLVLDASSLPSLGGAELEVDMTIDLPSLITVGGENIDEDGRFSLYGKLNTEGKIIVPPIEIISLNLSGYDFSKGEDITCEFNLDGVVRLSDASLEVDQWLGRDLNVSFNADIDDITISRLSGKVDYQVEPVVESVDLTEFSDVLTDNGLVADLDLYNAHLMLEITTNLSVAVGADMKLIPYYDGMPDMSRMLSANLSLTPAQTPGETKTTRFWISAGRDDLPSGYEYVEVDVLNLLRDIPEKIEVVLEAGTDPEHECVLDLSSDYVLNAAYRFDLPMAFGEDFCVTFKDTLTGIPDIVGQLMSKGKIMLTGDVTSTIPLGLDLSINLLDSNDNVIPMEDESGRLMINPCGLDGSAAMTEIELLMALAPGVETTDISSVELSFTASSAGVIGIPLTEESSLQVNLSLMLPEGFTIDLEDMLNE